jgi:hypothetical protein
MYKNNINNYILPFSYQVCPYKIINAQLLFDLLKVYQDSYAYDSFKKINALNFKLKPTWGIKFNLLTGTYEYELYFYQYDPNDRTMSTETMNVKTINKTLNLNDGAHINNQHTMFSIDLNRDASEYNFYYGNKITTKCDYGTSLKGGVLQNHYYRYYPTTISEDHKKYFDKKYMNFNLGHIKTLFLADKLHREYIGVYYDGISFKQLKTFLDKHNFNTNLINNYRDYLFSISFDINKLTNQVERIGLYGILY